MKNTKKQFLEMAPNRSRDLRTRPHSGGMQMASSLPSSRCSLDPHVISERLL